MVERLVIWAGILLGALISMGSASAGEEEGRKKAAPCAGCHGYDGNSRTPLYPKLAGQHELYLAKAMRAYQTGLRKDAVMKAAVARLSDNDIRDLAAYFAAQTQR